MRIPYCPHSCATERHIWWTADFDELYAVQVRPCFSVRRIFRCTRIGVGTYSVGNITGHGCDHDDAPTQILFLENACAVLGRDECTDHTIQSEQNTAY